MDEIAAGKGRRPKPFMLGKVNSFKANAIWHSNREGSARKPARFPSAPKARPHRRARKSAAAMPNFISPQLCKSVAARLQARSGCMRSNLTDTACSYGSRTARPSCARAKGWTGPTSLPPSPTQRQAFLTASSTAKWWRWITMARQTSRHCRRRSPRGALSDLVYFVFDLLFEGGEDLRHLPLTERKERLKRLLGRKGAHEQQIKYVEHLAEAGDAVLKSACRLNLEGIISKRADAPYQSGRTEAWMKAKCRGGHEVVIGGWSGSASNLRSLVVGVYRGDHLVHTARSGRALMRAMPAGCSKSSPALKTRQEPVRWQERASQGQGLDLGKAAPRCRDRVRGLYRRWHGAAGGLQRPAGGQAGKRGARGDAGTA